jgi:cell pole-organizing protein PopZ
VVTRLVEEQLPAIVERLVAQEIEKIKSSLESGE